MRNNSLFESKHVPVFIDGMKVNKRLKIGREKYKGVTLTARIEPLSAVLAAELGDDVKTTLFKRMDGELRGTVSSATLNYTATDLEIEVRPDPSMSPSVTLIDAKVDNLRPRQVGKTIVLTMTITVPVIGANDFLYLKDAVDEQRFMTFAAMQNGLFAEAEAEARRESKDAKPAKKGRHRDPEDVDLPVGDDAVATH